MLSILAYLELTKQELEKRDKTSKRLENYFKAIDNEETEKYWDRQDCFKKRMSWKDFDKKWRSKKMKRETITVTEDRIFVSSSEQDRVICPVCLATNTVLDLKCRNCGNIMPNSAIIVPNKENEVKK